MHSYGFVIVTTLDDSKLSAASLEAHIAARLAPFEIDRCKPGKFDRYEIGGRWDGLIERNRCSVDHLLDVPNNPLPYMILTLDGEWFDWEEHLDSRAGEDAWRTKARGILEAHRGMYIVTVDYHS